MESESKTAPSVTKQMYTSDGPSVGMAIAQPAETTQRSVVGG